MIWLCWNARKDLTEDGWIHFSLAYNGDMYAD